MVTGAELKTLRESLTLSITWCIGYFNKGSNTPYPDSTWRFWEGFSDRPIPEEVEKIMETLINEVEGVIDNQTASILNDAKMGRVQPIVLRRYKNDKALLLDLQGSDLKERNYPASLHALILLRVKQNLAKEGIECVLQYV